MAKVTWRERERYVEMRVDGYFCPGCHRMVWRDRETDVYFCLSERCDFKATADEFEPIVVEARRRSGIVTSAHKLRSSTPVVYYIKFRDCIKIGTAINPRTRISSLPCELVLGLEPGSFSLERKRHAQFQGKRVVGEWFLAHDELLAHIDDVDRKNADWRSRLYAHEYDHLDSLILHGVW